MVVLICILVGLGLVVGGMIIEVTPLKPIQRLIDAWKKFTE